MAVVDKYASEVREAGGRPSSLTSGAAVVRCVMSTASVASGDDDLSVYRLFTLPSNAVILSFGVYNTAITSGTDYEIGLYKVGVGGTVVDKDVLMGTTTMASARAVSLANNLGLDAVAITDQEKTLGELSGQTKPDPAYDVAITANVVGTANGTIVAKVLYATP